MADDIHDKVVAASYWSTAAVEIVRLAPRAPFIGEPGEFAATDWQAAFPEDDADA